MSQQLHQLGGAYLLKHHLWGFYCERASWLTEVQNSLSLLDLSWRSGSWSSPDLILVQHWAKSSRLLEAPEPSQTLVWSLTGILKLWTGRKTSSSSAIPETRPRPNTWHHQSACCSELVQNRLEYNKHLHTTEVSFTMRWAISEVKCRDIFSWEIKIIKCYQDKINKWE